MNFVPEYFLRKGNFYLEKDQKVMMKKKFGKLNHHSKYSTTDCFTFGGEKYTIRHVIWRNASLKSFDMYLTVVFKPQKPDEPALGMTISTDRSQEDPNDVTLKYSFVYFRSDPFNRILCTFTKNLSDTVFSKPVGEHIPEQNLDTNVSSPENSVGKVAECTNSTNPGVSESVMPLRRKRAVIFRSKIEPRSLRTRRTRIKSDSPIVRIRYPLLRHEKRNLSFFTRGRMNDGKNRISLVKLNEHFVDFKLYRDIDLGVNRQKQKHLLGLVALSHPERKRRLRLGRGMRKENKEEVLRQAHRQAIKQKIH
jgi:hypothetical protein